MGIPDFENLQRWARFIWSYRLGILCLGVGVAVGLVLSVLMERPRWLPEVTFASPLSSAGSAKKADWEVGEFDDVGDSGRELMEKFINDCKPDNWGDFSGFITQPKGSVGGAYNMFIFCSAGTGKLGNVKVKLNFWYNKDTFKADCAKGRQIVLLGFEFGSTRDKDAVYYAVSER